MFKRSICRSFRVSSVSLGFQWIGFVSNNRDAKVGVLFRRLGRNVSENELALSKEPIRYISVSTRPTASISYKAMQSRKVTRVRDLL